MYGPLEHGCYEVEIEINEFPFLDPVPEEKAVFIEVTDIMSEGLVFLPMKVWVWVRVLRVRVRVRVFLFVFCSYFVRIFQQLETLSLRHKR